MRYEGMVVDAKYDKENPKTGVGLIYSPITSKEYKFYQDSLPEGVLFASVVAGDKVEFSPSDSGKQRLAMELVFLERMLVCYQAIPEFVVTESAFFAGAVPLINKRVEVPFATGDGIEQLQLFAQRCGFNGILNASTMTDERGTLYCGDLTILAKPYPLHLASGPYIRYDLMDRYIARCNSKFEKYKVELGLQS